MVISFIQQLEVYFLTTCLSECVALCEVCNFGSMYCHGLLSHSYCVIRI